MSNPAHLAPPSFAQRLARVSFFVLGASMAVLVVSGITLAFGYEPGSSMASLHGAVGLLAVLAALVGCVCLLADMERSTAGIFPSIAVLLLMGGLYLTGPTLAWDQITANGPVDTKGVLVAFDDNVGALTRGQDAIVADDYRRIVYLHAFALPFLAAVLGGAGLWAARRALRDD